MPYATRSTRATRFAAVAAAALLLAATARPAHTQTMRTLAPGTRVRVQLEEAERRIVALVAEVRPDTLVLARPGSRIESRLPVRLEAIDRLEISGGRHRLTVIGIFVGAATGAALTGAYNGIVQSQCQPSCPEKFSMLTGTAIGVAAFGIGFHFLSRERWIEIALPGRAPR